MKLCKHSTWLRVIRQNDQSGLEIFDRLEKLKSIFPDGEERFPNVIFLLGNQQKICAFQNFGVSHLQSNSKRANGEVCVFATHVPTLQGNLEPFLVFDASSSSAHGANKTYRAPLCHESNVHKVALERNGGLEDLIHHRLLLPFSDVVCLFVDDLGGIAKVIKRLETWLSQPDSFSVTGIRPWLVFVVDKELQGDSQTTIRDLFQGKTKKAAEALFQGYRIFYLSVEGPQTRARRARRESQWDRLHREILALSQLSRRKRRKEDLLLSFSHISELLRCAAGYLTNLDPRPFDIVRASRLKNPTATDLQVHLTTFLRTMRSPAAVVDFGIPMIASALILDHYPPGMHCESNDHGCGLGAN